MSFYFVRRGDTLWAIAERELGRGQEWRSLARMNELRPPYWLVIGQRLRLPIKGQAQTSPEPRAPAWETPLARSDARPAEAGAGSLPARGFLFVLADEVLPSGKVVRKVLQYPKTVAEAMAARPEIFGLHPRDLTSKVTLGEHALGNTQSRFTSASSLPRGAPNMTGRPVYIDMAKARAAGVTIHSSEEIIADLYRLAQADPRLKARVEKLVTVIRKIEGEVLLEGHVPATTIKSSGAMAVTHGLRFVSVVGVVVTVYDLGDATVRSVSTRSVNPIAAEALRQAGGWGMAWFGMKAGCAAGALVGIETGPGAVLTCGVGGLAFGVAGYWGADWLADLIDRN